MFKLTLPDVAGPLRAAHRAPARRPGRRPLRRLHEGRRVQTPRGQSRHDRQLLAGFGRGSQGSMSDAEFDAALASASTRSTAPRRQGLKAGRREEAKQGRKEWRAPWSRERLLERLEFQKLSLSENQNLQVLAAYSWSVGWPVSRTHAGSGLVLRRFSSFLYPAIICICRLSRTQNLTHASSGHWRCSLTPS